MSSAPGKYALFRRGRGRMRHCLYPVDERAREAVTQVPEGEAIGVRVWKDRSLPMHNRFFKILDTVAKATDWGTAERLLVALKLRLGRYDLHTLPGGKIVPVPNSISFGAMPQGEFETFYQEAIHILQTEVAPGLDVDQIAIDAEQLASARDRQAATGSAAAAATRRRSAVRSEP
jgi:hypothetical protein